MNQSDCLLYLVTNSDHLAREPFLRVIEEALQNGVTLLQRTRGARCQVRFPKMRVVS